MKTRRFLTLALLLAVLAPLPGAGADLEAEDGEEEEEVVLPREFQGLSLGMSLEDLKAGLGSNALFSFREQDVSFLPLREETLIDTTGTSFVTRAFFQMDPARGLFIMAFTLNTRLIDHYAVFTTFTEKYGPPTSLNPEEAVWEDETTRVSVERPLTVKYIDQDALRERQETAASREAATISNRQEFLDGF